MARYKVCNDELAIAAIASVVDKRLGRGASASSERGYLKRLRTDVWDDRPRVVRAIKALETRLSSQLLG